MAAFLLLACVSLPAQKTDELGCDRSAIDWVLPGDFDTAIERAREEKRLIMIKGVSFGIDDAGAKCATKGKW